MNIADLRATLGYTQEQLSSLLGVHYMTVSNWERKNLDPSPYQSALLQVFTLAVRRDPKIGRSAYNDFVVKGLGFALHRVFDAAYGDRP